jgi:hypothetical protein
MKRSRRMQSQKKKASLTWTSPTSPIVPHLDLHLSTMAWPPMSAPSFHIDYHTTTLSTTVCTQMTRHALNHSTQQTPSTHLHLHHILLPGVVFLTQLNESHPSPVWEVQATIEAGSRPSSTSSPPSRPLLLTTLSLLSPDPLRPKASYEIPRNCRTRHYSATYAAVTSLQRQGGLE